VARRPRDTSTRPSIRRARRRRLPQVARFARQRVGAGVDDRLVAPRRKLSDVPAGASLRGWHSIKLANTECTIHCTPCDWVAIDEM
jgi:hypothetical protein